MKLRIFSIGIILLLYIAGCTKTTMYTKLPDETIGMLRLKYPCNDNMGNIDRISKIEHFSDLKDYEELFDAVIVVTLTGEYFTGTTQEIEPFEGEQTSTTPVGPTSFTPLYHSAIVDEVIWNREGYLPEEEIVLGFSSTLAAEMLDYKNCFLGGQTYVLFVNHVDKENIGRIYSLNKITAYYVSDEGVVLSVTSEPGINELTGVQLGDLKDAVTKVFKN
ncbi:MAG: hypothetical protein IKE00_03415 [Oscillospiraceae bacterium]|nr:hypothetical protein [Oscillospiraceae bacterium]